MSSQIEKDIESQIIFNNYIETNKESAQKVSDNKIEPNSTDVTNIKTNIIICIDNSVNEKNIEQTKKVKFASIKAPNKNTIKDFDKNYYENNKIEIKIEENKSSCISNILLGKKVKNSASENSYIKKQNNKNIYKNEMLKTKEQKFHNKNIIEEKVNKTIKVNNNININQKFLK